MPGKHTSRRNKAHKVYPYLLRNLKVDRPNQVWATEITYISMRKGSCTWSPLSTCIAVMCLTGQSQIQWMSNSARRPWRRPLPYMASRKSSIPTKEASSPRRYSPILFSPIASNSVWTEKEGLSTMYS